MNILRIDEAGLLKEYELHTPICASESENRAKSFALPEESGYVTQFGLILAWLRAETGAESGTLYAFDGYSLRFEYVQNEVLGRDGAVLDESGESLFAFNTDMVDKRTIYGYALVSRKSVLIDRFASIPNRMSFYVSPYYDDATSYRRISILTVPLLDGDLIRGAIQLINKRDGAGRIVPFSDLDLQRVAVFFEMQQSLLAEVFDACREHIAVLRARAGLDANATDALVVSAIMPPALEKDPSWLEGSGLVWTEGERVRQSTISRRIVLFTDYAYCFKDFDTLAELVLTEARNATGADAGTLYVVEDDQWLRLTCVQNDTLYEVQDARRTYIDRRLALSGATIPAYAAGQRRIVNVRDAWNLPAGVPYAFDRRLDDASGYRTVSLLSVPIAEPDGRVFAVVQLVNRRNDVGNVCAFDQAAEAYAHYYSVHVMPHLLMALQSRRTIERMLYLTGLHNPFEGNDHAARIASATVEIYRSWAEMWKVPYSAIVARCDLLFPAAMMHDLGMVSVPEAITGKSAALTPKERVCMQRHPALGAEMFARAEVGMECVAHEVILHHHQRWDGAGYTGAEEYPALAGEDIPVFARATAVADMLDGLLTPRPYKRVWTFAGALEQLDKSAGGQLDPEMVRAALTVEETLRAIYRRYRPAESEHAIDALHIRDYAQGVGDSGEAWFA